MASLTSPDGKYLILTKFQIEGKSAENLNEITIFQTFTNSSQEAIEGSYLYPKDSKCAISSLQIKTPTGIIKGQIHELEESKEKYNDAIAAGKKTFLSHTLSYAGDLMAIYVGNIPSMSEVEVQITFVSESTFNSEDNKWSIYIPNKFIERYHESRRFYDPESFKVYQPEVEIFASFSIKSHENIKSISSNIENFNIEVINSKSSVISFQVANKIDLRVTYELEASNSPWASIQQDPRTNFYGFQLSLTPEHPTGIDTSESEEPKCEFVILLDRSGSMHENNRIKLAKQALCLLLKSLPEDSYFNIVSFGHNYDPMFERSQKYTDKNIDYAINLISSFDADMGGTEIFMPLRDTLDRRLYKKKNENTESSKGFFANIFKHFKRNKKEAPNAQNDDLSLYSQYIILITDGGVGNTDSIVTMIKHFKGDARISTIGIGSGASTYLINEVAKAGDGSSQHILDSKEIKSAVIYALKAAIIPGFSQIQLLNNQIFEIVSPKIPFKCHYGAKIAYYGVIDNNEPLPSSIDVKYVSDLTKTEQIVEIPLNVTEADQSSAALVMAAGKYFETCSDQDLVSKSTKFQVLSKATAFLGVENAEIIQKSNYNERYSNFVRVGGLGSDVVCDLRSLGTQEAQLNKSKNLFGGSPRSRGDEIKMEKKSINKNIEITRSRGDEEKTEIEPNTKIIEDLIALQKIDGHWECSSELKILVNRILGSNKKIKNENTAFITALILAIFEEKFKEFENIWCLVAAKSKKWLKKNRFQEVPLIDLGFS